MTQQYLIGQLSVLLEELQPSPGDRLAAAVHELRREVERSPLWMLPDLASEAIGMTDLICFAAVERGDAREFARCVKAGVAIVELRDAARLLPE